MGAINYLTGDATSPKTNGNKIIVHICNDIGAWGKGFVLAISKKWNRPKNEYQSWCKSSDNFNSLYCHEITPAVPAIPAVYDAIDKKKNKDMKVFLLDKLRADYAGKYEHYYKIFLFEEKENSTTAGYSYGEKYIICFKSLSTNDGLVTHELLHGLELAHPFDGASRNTHFSYEFARTDNIMDYSAGQYKGLNAKTLFHWQWQIINSKIR